jgi:hypothetical protein
VPLTGFEYGTHNGASPATAVSSMKQIRCCLLLGASLLLAACATPRALKPSSWHLPWRHPPVAAPEPVSELLVDGVGGAAAPAIVQTWNRNNLRVDLTALTGSGEMQLRPRPQIGWPVRIEFAVRPGSFQRLEVQGAERVLFTVASSGDTQTLLLSPGAHPRTAASLAVRWD